MKNMTICMCHGSVLHTVIWLIIKKQVNSHIHFLGGGGGGEGGFSLMCSYEIVP